MGNYGMQVVVFVSGAVLMALEMLGSRILAPYFGSSIFVWGSLISVFLAALSVGYLLGGTYADRRPKLSSLAGVLAIAGAITAMLPWYYGAINEMIANADLGPRFGPLLAATLLFLVPSIFMGMVSPLAIRLQVTQLETVGNTAGTLYAVSTLGSIVGTLGTSFFLIAWLRVSLIVHLLGLTLLILAALLAFVPGWQKQPIAPATDKKQAKKHKKKANKALGLLIIFALAGSVLITSGGPTLAADPDFYATKKVFEKDSLYHHITVMDEGGMRYLRFDNSWQSGMDLRNPYKLVFDYTKYFHLGPLINPGAKKALFIGLGGGSVPKNFRLNYPNLYMDAIEIDPEVIRVAKEYFHVKEDDHLRLMAKDGRAFLRKSKDQYDLIFLDAYQADNIPFHLTTSQYLQELCQHLQPDGLVVSNIIGAVAGPQSRLFRAMIKTYQQVFAQVYVFPVWGDNERQENVRRNIVVIGSNSREPINWEKVEAAAYQLTETLVEPCDLPLLLAGRYTKTIPTSDVPVLDDDYAPVDALIHW